VIGFALLAMLAFPLAACGGGSSTSFKTYYGIRLENLPKHKVYRLNWLEGQPGAMSFRIKRLEVGPRGWSADVGFRNISKQSIRLPTGGQQSPIDFGLGVFINSLSPRIEDPGNYLVYAKKFAPALPKVLEPGQSWHGTMSSPQPPRASRYLRLVFGVFFYARPVPKGQPPFFLWVTSHGVQAPPRQGAAAAAAAAASG